MWGDFKYRFGDNSGRFVAKHLFKDPSFWLGDIREMAILEILFSETKDVWKLWKVYGGFF